MESDHNPAGLRSILRTKKSMCEDLWMEIFMRLPIETLCLFLLVCKSWKALILSSVFIKLHHSFNSSKLSANLKPYLHLSIDDDYTLYRPRKKSLNPLTQEIYFPFPNPKPRNSVDVIHGVVCVSFSLNSSNDTNILWNPSIHKYVALPLLPFPNLSDYPYIEPAIGFGYDSSKNDFKVLRIWIPDISTSESPMYEIYSLQQGIWRVKFADMNIKTYEFDTQRSSCFVNGIIHWLVREFWGNRYSMLIFDCETEEMTTMDLPTEIYNSDESEQYQYVTGELVEYGGMLSALVSHQDEADLRIDLWVMEKYGVSSTWIKLYKLQSLDLYGNSITVYESSFVNLVPHGPRQWIMSFSNEWIYHPFKCRVYEESMFLMDDARAQSYSKCLI